MWTTFGLLMLAASNFIVGALCAHEVWEEVRTWGWGDHRAYLAALTVAGLAFSNMLWFVADLLK